MRTAVDIKAFLAKISNKERALGASKFFKTGVGQYAAEDIFIGVSVPQLRLLARQVAELPVDQIEILLISPINEERLLALLILIIQFNKGDFATQERLYKLYLGHRAFINNWNLVDTSAPAIVGAYLFNRDKNILRTLAESPIVWERRIAIIATAYFIKNGQYDWTVLLSKMLLDDQHDLMHKAAGWMLREVGKKEVTVLEKFLAQHKTHMPRTMLRYAIERFSASQRKMYLSK